MVFKKSVITLDERKNTMLNFLYINILLTKKVLLFCTTNHGNQQFLCTQKIVHFFKCSSNLISFCHFRSSFVSQRGDCHSHRVSPPKWCNHHKAKNDTSFIFKFKLESRLFIAQTHTNTLSLFLSLYLSDTHFLSLLLSHHSLSHTL